MRNKGTFSSREIKFVAKYFSPDENTAMEKVATNAIQAMEEFKQKILLKNED
jgi:hypothetical protein